ncbi:MAG: HAD-IIIC family phosphatase [Lachnospiraceae bacterium]|nr:HAD-IIIC family phosphatase [Lachnospiraceae bacterium]
MSDERLRADESVSKLLKMANALIKDPEKESRADRSREPLKIAVLGTHSIQHYVRVLRLYLDRAGIYTDIYEGEYDGINMDVLDDDSELYKFKPDAVILMMRYSDLHMEKAEDVDAEMAYLKNLWSHLDKIQGVTVLQTNFASPVMRPFGGLEALYADSMQSLIRRLNMRLTEEHPSNVHVVDMEYLSSVYGKNEWFDEASYFLTKQGFSLNCMGMVANEMTNIINAVFRHTNKCLVLDLDNTLWGGVVGDDGPLGIEIDPHNAVGEAYRHFQKYVLALKKRGVILAVNSKNDEEVAKEPFIKNSDMILKLDDIACFCANWNDKASNMQYIAKSLNIGIDTLVFFDDNPAEREIVKKFCPEVTVIDVPTDAENYVKALDEAAAFEWASITKEDRERSDSYIQNAKREEMKSSFVNYDEYLKALEMKGKCGLVGDAELERFAQLTNKSNQFNLRTQRYSEGQIADMCKDEDTRCIYVSLTDKFSAYGVISCIVLRRGDKVEGFGDKDCFIDNWCMSCRVLKRGVEDFAFNAVKEEARRMGCTRIIGEYIPTKKNGMVESFYAKMGFSALEDNARVLYEYKLDDKVEEKKTWIQKQS